MSTERSSTLPERSHSVNLPARECAPAPAPPPIPPVESRLRIDDDGNFIDENGQILDGAVRAREKSSPPTVPRDPGNCARCRRPWHLGAVREGEGVKPVAFQSLVTIADGVFTESTLRTYSRNDRGAGKFYDCMTVVGSERRYDACCAMNIIDAHRGIDVSVHAEATAMYDLRCPTRRRIAAIEQQLARDFEEIAALEREDFSDAWMRRWRRMNEQLERIVKWTDEVNRRRGLRKPGGLFFTNRFRSRKKMIRSLFPEIGDERFDHLWRAFRHFLRGERHSYLWRFVTDRRDG